MEKTPKEQCTIQQYDRYRLRGPSGYIVAVGSKADIDRMMNSRRINEVVIPAVSGKAEFFAKAVA